MSRSLGPRDGDADLDRWVAAARLGDREAFGWIWQELSGRVAGYLRGRGVDAPDDVTSEVFLAAFSGLSRFTGDGARFRSWLFTIAHHKAVDELRRRRVDEEYDAASDPRTSPSAELDLLDSTLDHDVRAALAALTDEQREVLLLRTLGDLSVEQVATTTGRTIGAVKQLHHRAVASAQRALAARQAETPGTAYPRLRSVPEPAVDGASYSRPRSVVLPEYAVEDADPSLDAALGHLSVVHSVVHVGGKDDSGADQASETGVERAVTSPNPRPMTET